MCRRKSVLIPGKRFAAAGVAKAKTSRSAKLTHAYTNRLNGLSEAGMFLLL